MAEWYFLVLVAQPEVSLRFFELSQSLLSRGSPRVLSESFAIDVQESCAGTRNVAATLARPISLVFVAHFREKVGLKETLRIRQEHTKRSEQSEL